MTKIVTATDLRKHMTDVLDLAARGEDFVITRQGRPVARLMPFEPDDGALVVPDGTADDMAPPRMPTMEKVLQQVGKLVEGQEFDSLDDMNAYVNEMLAAGGLPDIPPETPLEKAQDLIYQAWEEPRRKKRIKLAKQALKISPDCADAYVLLAEQEARSLNKALAYYEQGVAAGERALGAEFDDLVGHFWGVTETRPYMRARAGLAYALWDKGEHDRAIGHLLEMLDLNPSDNQGMRHVLISWLLLLRKDEKAAELLQRYEDDATAIWQYSRAFHLYRTEGRSEAAAQALAEAFEWNTHVPAYLLGRKRVPDTLPDYVGFGDESEAVVYAATDRPLWQQEPGALAWLEEQVGG